MKTTYGFSRRGPDKVAEELATVLSKKATFEFKALFTVVHANLRLRNAASGGEEMLRLRAYEKLQNLVQAGYVKKTGKEYKGVPKGLESFLATAAELNAKFAAGHHSRPPAVGVPVK
jgi:predicted transcriptional regulator